MWFVRKHLKLHRENKRRKLKVLNAHSVIAFSIQLLHFCRLTSQCCFAQPSEWSSASLESAASHWKPVNEDKQLPNGSSITDDESLDESQRLTVFAEKGREKEKEKELTEKFEAQLREQKRTSFEETSKLQKELDAARETVRELIQDKKNLQSLLELKTVSARLLL